MSKKTCVNCAFLLRCQKTYISVNSSPERSHWDDHTKSLTIENRNSIKNKNLSFLGEDVRNYESFKKEYQQKKQEKQERLAKEKKEQARQKFLEQYPNPNLTEDDLKRLQESAEFISRRLKNIPPPTVEPINLNPLRKDDEYSEKELKEFGLTQPPTPYTHDYLKCYHEEWTENRDRSEPIHHRWLNTKSCPSYYPYKKMNKKSLKACERSREYKKNQKQFWITNSLVLLGVFTTLLVSHR